MMEILSGNNNKIQAVRSEPPAAISSELVGSLQRAAGDGLCVRVPLLAVHVLIMANDGEREAGRAGGALVGIRTRDEGWTQTVSLLTPPPPGSVAA